MLELRALGLLVVLVDGRALELGRGHERALVALLALHAGEPLTSDRIVDSLWNGEPPPSAREMVRNYVGRVRKALGETAITTTGAGYVLDVEPEAVDVLRFERLAKAGAEALAEGTPERALPRLDEALSLWRGRPLVDLESTDVGRHAVLRLEELRLRAIEDRIEAELALGRASTLVGELEQLVRENPYRERLLGQLMLALYRCGRQKEALDRYQTGRGLLVEEVGLEPGPQLQDLQRAILRHDPSLDASRAQQAPHRTDEWRGGKRRRVWPAIAGAIAVAAAVVLLVALSRGSSQIALHGDSLGVLNPVSGRPVRAVRLRGLPLALAVTSRAAWVGVKQPPGLIEVDPATFRVLRTIPVEALPFAVAATGRSLWASNGYEGSLIRVEGRGPPSPPFRPEPHAIGLTSLAYGFGALWAGSQDDTLTRLDPRDDRPSVVIHGTTKPLAIATGSGGVWVAEASRDALVHVDPRTERIAQEIPIGGRAVALAVGDGSVWAVTPAESLLWRINPRSNAVVSSIPIGGNAIAVAATKGGIWVASADGWLTKVDPRTDDVNRIVNLHVPVADLTAGSGRLWLTTR